MKINTVLPVVMMDEEIDTIEELEKQLPDDAKIIFNIINPETTPRDFVVRYGGKTPTIRQISEYTGFSPMKIKQLKKIIQTQCKLLGLI